MNRLFIALIDLLFPFTGAIAQEIYEQEHGLFSTKEITNQVTLGSQNRLVIRSAVNLSGKLHVTSAPGRQIKLTAYASCAG